MADDLTVTREQSTFAGLGDVVLGAIDAHLHPQLHEADTGSALTAAEAR